MKFHCTIKRLATGDWQVRYQGPRLGTVAVTAASQDEALAKMRAELRFRVESCPCGGVPDDYVELEVQAEPPAHGPPPGMRAGS
jgi:hypothetical protein